MLLKKLTVIINKYRCSFTPGLLKVIARSLFIYEVEQHVLLAYVRLRSEEIQS